MSNPRFTFGFTLAFLLHATSAAMAAGGVCTGRTLTEVKAVAGIPPDVYALLGGSGTGLDGIADRGGKFNSTDVVDKALPMRRFVLAGSSSNCVAVALEHGGRGHSIELWVFSRNEGTWLGERQGRFKVPPRSLKELTHNAIR
jgi:hypothetical protein